MPSLVTEAEVLGGDRSSDPSGAETQALVMIMTETLQIMVGVPRRPGFQWEGSLHLQRQTKCYGLAACPVHRRMAQVTVIVELGFLAFCFVTRRVVSDRQGLLRVSRAASVVWRKEKASFVPHLPNTPSRCLRTPLHLHFPELNLATAMVSWVRPHKPLLQDSFTYSFKSRTSDRSQSLVHQLPKLLGHWERM